MASYRIGINVSEVPTAAEVVEVLRSVVAVLMVGSVTVTVVDGAPQVSATNNIVLQ